MKILKFGCKRSDFILSSRDHKSVKEDSEKLQWFVMCRFYEPEQKPFVFKLTE